jgi:penicillin-binding protein 1A
VERTLSLPANSALRALDVLGLTWVTEDDFTKQQILEMYLNDVYFGRGAYGIAAAAQRYFHTSPQRLDVAQAAFLASLPQAPSVYGRHPYSAIAQGRRRVVIRDLAQQGYITAREEREALRAPFAVAG